jgi:hypothetical protein
MKKLIDVIVVLGLVYTTCYFDCGSNYPPPPAVGGFYIETQVNGEFQSFVNVSGIYVPPPLSGTVFRSPASRIPR